MQVAVLMGSDSDWQIVKEVCVVLRKFKIGHEVRVLSAHRSPADLLNYVKHCEEIGCQIYICAAGKAAHLSGVVAAHTTKPVIGIPISSSLHGVDSLYSTVQMPGGIPVATVAIDSGVNAGLLAVQMLSLFHEHLAKQLFDYREQLRQSVLSKDRQVQELVAALGPN